MKIKQTELAKLIRESMQELALEALEEELELEQATPDIEQSVLQGTGMNRSKVPSGSASGTRPGVAALNATGRPTSNVKGSESQRALAGAMKLGQGEKDAMVTEQDDSDADLEEQWGARSASRGAFGSKMGGSARRPSSGDGGRAELAAIAKRDDARKASAAQAVAADQRKETVKKNPFTAMNTQAFAKTGQVTESLSETKIRKIIRSLVQEVIAEGRKSKKSIKKTK